MKNYIKYSVVFILVAFLSMSGKHDDDFLLAALQQGAPSSNHYPNQDNPNPELVTNDAASLDPTENVASINITRNSSIGATREVSTSDNGWVTYSRKITATSSGSLKRDRLRKDNALIVGEVYAVDLLHRCDNATNTVRQSINSTTGTYDENHTAHTDWQLHSFEYTALTTSLQFEQFVRTISITGQWTEYNVSVKLKDD